MAAASAIRVNMDARAIIGLVILIGILAWGFSFDNIFGRE